MEELQCQENLIPERRKGPEASGSGQTAHGRPVSLLAPIRERASRERKSVYGKTQADVRKKMTAILRTVDSGTYQAPDKTTVAEWLDEWMKTFCAVKVKPLTYSSYEVAIKNHIKPAIGAVKIQAVKGVHIQKLYNSMTAAGLSPKTVKNVAAILHKAFSVAQKQGMVQGNPCDAAELPKATQKEIKPLTDAEIPLFMQAHKGLSMENAYAALSVCRIT